MKHYDNVDDFLYDMAAWQRKEDAKPQMLNIPELQKMEKCLELLERHFSGQEDVEIRVRKHWPTIRSGKIEIICWCFDLWPRDADLVKEIMELSHSIEISPRVDDTVSISIGFGDLTMPMDKLV